MERTHTDAGETTAPPALLLAPTLRPGAEMASLVAWFGVTEKKHLRVVRT
jgi:hypothetical protein